MSAIRYVLQFSAFTFFAAWFLCLVADRPFPISKILLQSGQEKPVPVKINVKPSPLEMLRKQQLFR